MLSLLFVRSVSRCFVSIKMACDHPADLHMPQTCKTLREASLSRSLWKILLQVVCTDNFIFPPTFSTDHMSLQDLEHACTSPTRFVHFLRGPAEGTLFSGSFSQRWLDLSSPAYKGLGYDGGEVLRLSLIPGGRYLISHHDTVIHMWDLGNTRETRDFANICPLASVNLQCSGNTAIIPHCTRDGLGILFFTCVDDDPESRQWCAPSKKFTGNLSG